MESGFDLEVRTCPICGKTFVPAAMHMYRKKHVLFCSWTCYRKDESQHSRRGRGKRVEQYTLDGEYIQTFDRAADAINLLGYTQLDNFYKACRSGRAYKGYIWKYAEEMED